MALNASLIEDQVRAAVEAELKTQFPDGIAAALEDLAVAIAKAVGPIIDAITNDAEVTVTSVQSGTDTAAGTIA